MSDLADLLIDDILRDYPGHQPGTRPVHAPGIAAKGWFRANPVAPLYTAAEHLSGERIPVTVRFSDGTGLPEAPLDPAPVRGMAVKFHLSGGRQTDLVAMSLPVFFARTVDAFRALCTAAVPVATKPRPWWRRLLDDLTLVTPVPDPPVGVTSCGERGVFEFANHYPPARTAVTADGLLCLPESYTSLSYHAVHAFKLTAEGGQSYWVRFHWEPVGGVRPAGARDGGDLREALLADVGTVQAEFVLRAQIGEAGDDPADPTRPWPQRRKRIVLGHLWLDEVPQDQRAGCELLHFNPAQLTPGIEGCPDDPILEARRSTYARSYERRRAELGDH